MKVTALIFKDYEEINRRTGEISKKSGLFTTANYKQVEAGAYYNFKTNAGAIVETVKANREYANGLITLEERNDKVAKATEGCTEEVKKQCDNTKMSYAEGKKAILNLKEQETAATKVAKAQNGLGNSIKNFAKNNASMFKNIGASLAIGFAIQAAGWAWDTLNDKFKITPEKKIEAMETAINKYNDAISQSSENTKTIKSLKDEFNQLAKGVDESGKNISLSAEEYSRYNEIANQLASI